jgi:proteasome-associated ATPase
MTTHNPFHFDLSYGLAPTPEQKIVKLENELKYARERLEQLNDMPAIYACVIDVLPVQKRVVVVTGSQIVEVALPARIAVTRGVVVRLQGGGGGSPPAIMEIVEAPPSVGQVSVIKQVIDDSHVEVIIQNQSRSVVYPPSMKVKANDQVVLDFTNSAVIRNLGSGNKSRLFTEDTGVSWDDIGGLEDVKALLREAIEEPIKYAALYQKYKRRPTRGVLLYGPPGTGKTFLGKACATALAKVHGVKNADSGFVYVKGPEMLGMYVGSSEGNVRSLFAAAREHKARMGYPAIIFVDEADALMGKRGAATRVEGMERTIVPQFLAEMDGLEDAGCMVLLATNRPDSLDPAITRRGRVDRKILVRRPTQSEAEHVFKLYLKDLPFAKDVTLEALASAGAAALFDDKYRLYVLRTKSGKDAVLTLKDLASGAEIAGLADDVAQRALRRERDGGKGSGIALDDMIAAVRESVLEQASLNHDAELKVFIEDNKVTDVVKIEKVKS